MRLHALLILAAAAAGVLEAQSVTGNLLKKQPFGKTTSGEAVDLYTLTGKQGMKAAIMTYGAIVVSLEVPDRDGKPADVVLGFDSVDGYIKANSYYGSVVGRYGNRIAKGKFTINGVPYATSLNNGENSLHGGLKGFNQKVWKARDVSTRGTPRLELTYESRDGEEGYPGTLTATVTYSLTDANELRLDYSATTNKDTVVNLTNHSYFNLSGSGSGDILGHVVTLVASRFTPTDAASIPTGEIRSVENTPFDFRRPRKIGERINDKDQQLVFAKGYDDNYVLDSGAGRLALAAKVYDPKSGRMMEVITDQPGVQFYTGNKLDGSLIGKGGKPLIRNAGLCLETQHFPDSPNHANFPSTILKAGARYRTTTVYRFSNAQLQ